MKPSFKAGDVVYHSRLGEGVILAEWGSWTDKRGKEMRVNGAGIYEVQFKTDGTRCINGCWLAPDSRAASSGAKPV